MVLLHEEQKGQTLRAARGWRVPCCTCRCNGCLSAAPHRCLVQDDTCTVSSVAARALCR